MSNQNGMLNSYQLSSEYFIALVGFIVGMISSYYIPENISPRDANIISIAIIGLGAAIGVVVVFVLKKIFSPKIINIFVVLVILTTLSFGFYTIFYNKYSPNSYIPSGVNIRSNAALNSRVIQRTTRSTSIDIIGKSWRRYRISIGGERKFDFWVKVRTDSGGIGWVFGSLIKG